MSRGPAEDQLNLYKKNLKGESGSVTNSNAAPIGIRDATQTAGPRGPILLQDVNFIDEMAHFTRERIPERVVHAKGAGAFGYFEVTHSEITKYCAAKIFDTVGKRTPMNIRFSTVGGESGSADTVRDPRGFAMKFYTEDGIWDLVGNNTPIFFIRDPILFPSFIHTQKRNPQTHLKDPDMFWDFISLRPETTHQVLFLFSDRGLPDGFRHMNGYGSHTYKFVNKSGEKFYCKFHFKTDQKIKNLPVDVADKLSATDPDYSLRDLYNAIEKGQFPSWTSYVQIMTYAQAEKFKFNPFDLTKVWSQKEYPLIRVGKFTLDRNPKNYFAEVEQAAYSPSNLVPGIEPSPDKMLQGRLFAYADTHRHRLGANHMQIPVNCPYRVSVKNYQRDGPQCYGDNQAGAPNYFPNSFGGPLEDMLARKLDVKEALPTGDVHRYSTATNEDNYTQSAIFYNQVLKDDERKRLYTNMGNHLAGASAFIQERAIKNFANVSPDLANKLTEIIKLRKSANL